MEKFKKILYVISALLLVALVVSIKYPIKETKTKEVANSLNYVMIYNDSALEFNHKSKAYSLDYIGVEMVLLSGTYQGNISIKAELDGNEVSKTVIDGSSLQSNSEILIPINCKEFCYDKNYKVSISSDVSIDDATYGVKQTREENKYIIYSSEKGYTFNYTLSLVIGLLLLVSTFCLSKSIFENKDNKFINFIRNSKLTYLLLMGLSFLVAITILYVSYKYGIYRLLKIKYLLPIICGFIGISLFLGQLITKETLKERIFLALAIPIGMLYLVLIMPGESLDDQYHYTISYQLATMNFKMENKFVPVGFDKRYRTYAEMLGDVKKETDYGDVVEYGGQYSPLLYIPSSTGVFAAKTLGLNMLIGKYMGAAVNYLLFLIIGFFIIKFLPFGKILGIAYLFNPMILQSCTSFSCDCLLNLSTIFFVVYILHLKYDKVELKSKHIILLGLSMAIMICAKAMFAPFMLLLFLLWKPFMKLDNKRKIKYLGILFVFFLVGISWYIICPKETYEVVNFIDPRNNLGRIKTIFTSPIYFLRLIFQTLKEQGVYLFQSSLGKWGSWYDYSTNSVIPMMYFYTLLFAAIFGCDDKSMKISDRVLFLVLKGIVFGFTLVLFFVGNTDVTSTIIPGLQGRYFVPSNLLFYFCLVNKSEYLKIKIVDTIVIILILIVQIFFILATLQYYI